MNERLEVLAWQNEQIKQEIETIIEPATSGLERYVGPGEPKCELHINFGRIDIHFTDKVMHWSSEVVRLTFENRWFDKDDFTLEGRHNYGSGGYNDFPSVDIMRHMAFMLNVAAETFTLVQENEPRILELMKEWQNNTKEETEIWNGIRQQEIQDAAASLQPELFKLQKNFKQAMTFDEVFANDTYPEMFMFKMNHDGQSFIVESFRLEMNEYERKSYTKDGCRTSKKAIQAMVKEGLFFGERMTWHGRRQLNRQKFTQADAAMKVIKESVLDEYYGNSNQND